MEGKKYRVVTRSKRYGPGNHIFEEPNTNQVRFLVSASAAAAGLTIMGVPFTAAGVHTFGAREFWGVIDGPIKIYVPAAQELHLFIESVYF